MKINFRKQRNSILNTIFLKLEYMSGDADAFQYEEVSFGEHITFLNYKEHLKEIEDMVKQYQLIAKLTDGTISLVGVKNTFQYIKENYSEEIAHLYGDVPRDSTCVEFTACLSEITLGAYNDKGEYFESYI